MMYKNVSIVALILGLALTGCSSSKPSNVTDAERLNDPHIKDAKAPPINANTRFAAGQVAEVNGNIDGAIAQYKEALKVDPNHVQTLYHLGMIYAGQNRFDDAIGIWRQYVKATNESAIAYSNLGYCCDLAGRQDDAKAAYESGLKQDPNNRPCRTNYGLLLARQGHVPDALNIWRPILSPAETHYNLASVYENNGDKRQARIEYQKALELDPKFIDAKSRLAQLDLN